MLAQALQAQAIHEKALLNKLNVVGVAVGFKEAKRSATGEVAVVVLVEQKKPLAALAAQDIVPPELDGLRTDVYEVGHLRALLNVNPRGKFRPIVPNGVSVGHYKITAGTLSTIVKDKTTGDKLLLSNNHVFANSNDCEVGDPILQPAAMDGGELATDVVARLERYVRLRFLDDPLDEEPLPEPTPDPDPIPLPTDPPGPGPRPSPRPGPVKRGGCDVVNLIANFANFVGALVGSDKRLSVASQSEMNAQAAAVQARQITAARMLASGTVPENTVDCALARPLDPNMFSDDILSIGIVDETDVPSLGMRVRKYGRTTAYTEGNVTLLNATVNVAYSTVKGPRTARFVGQVITTAMSQGGDSGSLIVETGANKAVGLLFAGSNLATIFTPIDVVLAGLNITL